MQNVVLWRLTYVWWLGLFMFPQCYCCALGVPSKVLLCIFRIIPPPMEHERLFFLQVFIARLWFFLLPSIHLYMFMHLSGLFPLLSLSFLYKQLFTVVLCLYARSYFTALICLVVFSGNVQMHYWRVLLWWGRVVCTVGRIFLIWSIRHEHICVCDMRLSPHLWFGCFIFPCLLAPMFMSFGNTERSERASFARFLSLCRSFLDGISFSYRQ